MCVVRLPLTLAILDGLLLHVGAQSMVIPVIAVTEFLRPTRAQVQSLAGQRVLMLRGQALPIVRLADVYGIADAVDDPCAGLVLVIDSDGRRFGLLVDGLTGQSQVVLKSLEANYRRIDGILGATILGDGAIALIIDVAGLTRTASSRRAPTPVAA